METNEKYPVTFRQQKKPAKPWEGEREIKAVSYEAWKKEGPLLSKLKLAKQSSQWCSPPAHNVGFGSPAFHGCKTRTSKLHIYWGVKDHMIREMGEETLLLPS